MGISNREWASLIWATIFVCWALTNKDIRRSCRSVLAAFSSFQIQIVVAAMAAYLASEVFLFSKMRLWTGAALKDTCIWVVGTAFVLLMNASKADRERDHFRMLVREAVGIALVVEFIVGLHSFNLAVELVLIPILTMFALVDAFAEHNLEYAQVKKVTGALLTVAGFALFGYSVYVAALEFEKLAVWESLRSLLLIPLLTIGYLPFVYAVALVMLYEQVFVRLGFSMIQNPEMRTDVKKAIVRSCHGSFQKLKIVSKKAYLFNAVRTNQDMQDVLARVLTPPPHLLPTRFSIVGHWRTFDCYVESSQNAGTKTDFYVSPSHIREVAELHNGGRNDRVARYALSSLNETERLVKVTVYSDEDEVSREEALRVSVDGRTLDNYAIDMDMQQIDFSAWQRWEYVGGEVEP